MSEPPATHRPAVLLALTVAATLGMLASTIYVPSIPAIARGLDTSISRVQFTFVGYLLAFAVGMLVMGPLSDRFGRRCTLLCGLALSAVSGIACTASLSIGMLIAARVVQGFGACAGIVVGRAAVQELYGRERAAAVIAALAIAVTLMQSFAPIPGGYLQAWIGWRANFAAAALFAVAALALAYCFVPETCDRAAAPRSGIGLRMLVANSRMLVGTRQFLAYALVATGAHAGFHIFAAGGPAVLIGGMGIRPEQYGFYAALPPIGYLVGSFVSNRLSQRLGVDNLIRIGSAVLVPGGLGMLALAVLHVASPYAVVGPMVVVCCGSGLISPNAVAGSLAVHGRTIGTAAGLTSFFQMSGAAAATAALSLGPGNSALVLAGVVALSGLFAVTAFGVLTHSAERREAENGCAQIDLQARF